MKRLNGNVCGIDRPLEKRPKSFQPVRLNLSASVLFGVVYNLIREITSESFVGKQRIYIQSGPSCHVLTGFGLKFFFLSTRNDRGPDLACLAAGFIATL